MNKKYSIKLLSVVMSLAILCGLLSPAMASAASNNAHTGGLQMFFDEGSHSQLVDCPDAVYMDYAEILRTDSKASIAMIALGIIYGGADYKEKIEPNKDQYMLALVNVMRTYESENAASMTEQNQMDNTKELKDYLFDVVDIELGITNVSGVWDEMKEEARIAISGITQSLADIDDWSKGLAVLETTLQNYEKFDIFLQLVQTNSEGALKEAAADLRAGLSELMKTRLSTYGELLLGSAEKGALVFKDAIFDKAWMDWMKSIDVSNASKGYKWLTNYNIFYFDTLQWVTLGVEIGKLVGNLSMGAEDVMAYIVEIKAVHDISVVLEDELENIKYSFQKDNSKVTASDAQKYITYGNYLISCRLRGQYCMTAIYLQPSLRNLFSGDTAQNAESLYNRLTINLLSIKKKLDAICSGTSLTQLLSGIEADSIQYYNCSESGKFAVIEKNGKYGLIDYSGNIILPIEYESIEPHETSPSGQEIKLYAYDSNYQGYWIEQDGSLTPEFLGGWGFEGGAEIYWWNEPVMFDYFEGKIPYSYEAYASYHHGSNVLGTITKDTADVIPVQQINGSSQTTAHGMTTYTVKKVSEKYALLNLKTKALITDFVFDDYGYSGFIEGILAVCKENKWGYIDENGNMITDFIYDASEVTPWANNYMYSSLNNHIIVRQGDLWGLIDNNGNAVVETAYDGISQVNPDGMFWLKENGTWSLYQMQIKKVKLSG